MDAATLYAKEELTAVTNNPRMSRASLWPLILLVVVVAVVAWAAYAYFTHSAPLPTFHW
jgi:hypothetical protein